MRISRCGRSFAVWLVLYSTATSCPAQERDVKAGREEFYATSVRPLFAKYCFGCHSGDRPEADLRLDQLTPDFSTAAGRNQWNLVVDRVAAGEMPPKSKPRPSESEWRPVSTWIVAHVREGTAAERKRNGRVVLRRLNRTEYENTVRDLLGVSVELKDLLPPDGSQEGFDNVGDALHVSSFLLERYLEAAETALDVAIANRPRPPLISKRYSLTETHQVKSTTESVFRKSADGGVVMFSSSAWQAVSLSPFYPPDRGDYRFRISASGVQSSGKPVTYRVDAGLMLMTGKPHLVGYFDAPPDQPTVLEFVDSLEPRNTIRILPYGLASAQAVNKVGADIYDGPGLAVDWVEVEGPLHATWPPESHRRIFGDLPQVPAPIYNQRDRVEVISNEPPADAERILRRFIRRAFRRAVTADDVGPFVTLVESKLSEGRSFEQAVRVALAAVLVSPEFLFLDERPGPLDDFALAGRLSYFLWSTMPDEELLDLAERSRHVSRAAAESGREDRATNPTLPSLRDPTILRQQIDRMLDSPKAAAFVENFTGQWLGLRDIDFTEPSHILYPEFDHMLKVSMVRETELFFAELLKHDLSIANLIASDFTMLNGRLAKHYGIPGVDGWEFRKVHLPPDSHRGGVLTMASVLKVTANGTTTSPVMRGAWVLDRILGTPPPRPPENVAALEPDIRGATTIREQLAKHRQVESCATCHRLIDPPGFALESFDVIGGWREFYRTSGNGKPIIVDGQRMRYLQGKPVDAADVLPDGRAFAGIDDYKKLLLADLDQFAAALTKKLLTYATGGPPTSADEVEIESIVARARAKKYGLRSLVHEVVQSSLFHNK
jgi:hypothetical protein